MTAQLKPCPFCGSDDIYIDGIGREYMVYCNPCGYEPSEAKAIKAWNTRPIEDELRAEVEKLRKENHRMRSTLEYYANTGNWADDQTFIFPFPRMDHGSQHAAEVLQKIRGGAK